jgi:hypothetical protein
MKLAHFDLFKLNRLINVACAFYQLPVQKCVPPLVSCHVILTLVLPVQSISLLLSLCHGILTLMLYLNYKWQVNVLMYVLSPLSFLHPPPHLSLVTPYQMCKSWNICHLAWQKLNLRQQFLCILHLGFWNCWENIFLLFNLICNIETAHINLKHCFFSTECFWASACYLKGTARLITYRVICEFLRNFWTQQCNSQDRHSWKEHISR